MMKSIKKNKVYLRTQKDFIWLLNNLMVNYRLSVAKMADKLEIDSTVLYRYLKGTRPISLDVMCKTLTKFKVYFTMGIK